MEPTSLHVVIPSRIGVGESFAVKARVLGPVRSILCKGGWNTLKPALYGPFNRNVKRGIQYLDNCLPEWSGTLSVEGEEGLEGPDALSFDGSDQGVFPGDTRPIKVFEGFRWTSPGFHFLKLREPSTGAEFLSNPVDVTSEPPDLRLYWGDPHWQTFFSDGIRCPEELYAFARDEAFLDFGALADHVEALTDRQWEYFVDVTNDYNELGRFATLVGLEWTNHAPGHRNVYYRGDYGPVLRSRDPKCDTLEKLWAALEGLDAIAIPHHTSNVKMGCDWSLGWNPKYEKAVEIYSIWGNSECPAEHGNPRPIRHVGGEEKGHHVIDALRKGFRFGFVGGGDIHDGRPGDCLAIHQPELEIYKSLYTQGLTAALAPDLTRDAVYDAIRDHRTYATTNSRIYLDVSLGKQAAAPCLNVKAASEDGIQEAVLVRNGEAAATAEPTSDRRIVETRFEAGISRPEEFCYVRLHTDAGNMAWSSPVWGDEIL